MPGELWRQIAQVGLESTPGTPVVATRKMYLRDLTFSNDREQRLKRFWVGRRDNQLAATQGPDVVAGSATCDVSADELMEWAQLCFGAPTTTTPGGATLGRQHVYKPSTNPSAGTIEYMDGSQNQRAAGVRVDTMEIAGSVDGDLTCSLGFFGQGLTDAFGSLASLADRTPTYMDGWQTNLYVDGFAGTPGTTAVTGALVNWRVNIANQMSRLYTAANTQVATGVNFGELMVEGHVTLLASAAAGIAELANWSANTSRMIRLEFLGPANSIETGQRHTVRIDVPANYAPPDRGAEAQGSRVYQLNFNYLYQSTLAAGVVFTLINARTAAFA